ncbi:hypothetical protein LLG90_01685 [Aromatoleum toluclasticum]|uniref:hypothetical protein n=1 Tax=Aromatoleum toluclasticum TaxID=92003 RepID=UPI001D18B66D|nr:hypothetical protein [Aromatoleum toluclasticum]MCC4114054.1 hypothetical protein [Aromatoleum toluclasticum]
MNPVALALRDHRARVPLVGAALLAPWLWSIFLLPLWAIAVSLLLTLAAAVFILVRILPPARDERADDSGGSDAAERLRKARRRDAEQRDLMHQTIFTLHTHVHRWVNTSEHSQGDLRRVQSEVGQVLKHVESAIVQIGESFSAIMNKTAAQTECAMKLLRSEDGDQAAKNGAWLSLPDYIHAYESQLSSVTERMIEFAAVTGVFEEHQRKMREHTVTVDDLLDELRAMAKQTGKLALESSMLAGSAANHRHLVTLTDTIRSISEKAHETTRSIRLNLDAIREQLVESHKTMRTASEIGARAATQAKVDVAQLNLAMMDKTAEVKDAVEHINLIGNDVQVEINRIIVAMQFQDITQQKLERLHQPVLSRVIEDLRVIADESTRLKGEAGYWLNSSVKADAPFQLVRGGVSVPLELREAAVIAADEPHPVPSPVVPKDGGSVELF